MYIRTLLPTFCKFNRAHLLFLLRQSTGLNKAPAPTLPPLAFQPQNVQRVRPPQLCLVDGKIEETDWEALEAVWANWYGKQTQLGSVLGETYTKVIGRLGPVVYEALT